MSMSTVIGVHASTAEQVKQEEEKQLRYQKTDEEYQDSVFWQGVKNWTGVDKRNFMSSEDTDVGSGLEGLGEIALAPAVTGFKVIGGVLGFGAKLVAPVFGFLGSALGGITGGGQGAPQGGGAAAQGGGYTPAAGGGSPAPTTTSSSSTSTAPAAKTSTSTSISSDKTGSTPRVNNTEAGSVDTFTNIKTGATQSILLDGIDTQGLEQVSQLVRVDVEELKEADADVEKYQRLYDEADKKVTELKAQNQDKKANAKAKAQAEVAQYDRVINEYTTKIDGIQRDIAGQEALLAKCKPDDPKRNEYSAAIARLKAEKDTLMAQIQEAVNKKAAAERTLESLKGEPDVDAKDIEAQIAQAEAQRDAYKVQLENAKAVQASLKTALQQDVDKTDGSQYNENNIKAAKARQKKDNETADKVESHKKFSRKDVDNTFTPEEEKVAEILQRKSATAPSAIAQGPTPMETPAIPPKENATGTGNANHELEASTSPTVHQEPSEESPTITVDQLKREVLYDGRSERQ